MATQKRFTNYKASVESFPLGEEKIGLFKPGRYNGFDVMTTNDNITLNISHAGIITKSDPLGNAINVYGALITPTGLVIHQEGDIQVNLPPTSPPTDDQPKKRKYILVCEHNYQAVKGGVPASYFIIANPEFGDGIPELGDKTTQVILGIITRNYDTNELTYEKKQAPLLADRTPLELYNLIKEFIQIPQGTELPDIEGMITRAIEKNKPKVIVTPPFDIGESAGQFSLSQWETLYFDKYVDIHGGHNLDKHAIRVKQTRIGTANAYIDIELTPHQGMGAEDIRWTWENTRVLSVGWVNDPDQGARTAPPLEIRGNVEGSQPGTLAKRFQVLEYAQETNRTALKIVIEHKGVIKGSGNLGETYLRTDKTAVEINAVYPYPQTVKLSSSKDWTATADNGQISITPTEGKAGETNVSLMIAGTSGLIEGIVTFTSTDGLLSTQVKVTRDNTMGF